MFSGYHMEWKIFIEANCTNTYALEKKFFAVATFDGLWVVSFQAE